MRANFTPRASFMLAMCCALISLTASAAAASDPAAGSVGLAVDDVVGFWHEHRADVVRYGLLVAQAFVFLVLAWIAARWVSRGTRQGLERAGVEHTLAAFMAKLSRWIVMVLAGLACLTIFGFEITSFAALVGSAGIAVGLALQGSLSNIAAGAVLAITRPFRINDFVTVAGQTGSVHDIDVFSTHLNTLDNRRIIIPNSQILGAIIENASANDVRRVEFTVGVDYEADVDATRAAIERAVRAVPGQDRERKASVVLQNLGASSVDWVVYLWSPRDSMQDVRQAAIRAVKNEVEGAGLTIPYPQMVVHLQGENRPR